jgi:hypothetical protein
MSPGFAFALLLIAIVLGLAWLTRDFVRWAERKYQEPPQ